MKNSKEYSKKVQKLYRELKNKQPKVQKVSHATCIDALVYAILSEDLSEKTTQSALAKFGDYFVDLNDLRVSRAEEITDMVGEDTEASRKTAFHLTTALRSVFDKYNEVSLESLSKLGKRPARQALEKLEGVSRFAVNYCMLTFLQGHAIPLTARMLEYLKDNEMVDAGAGQDDIEGFLTRQISANKAYEFYALLRHESETAKPKPKKKTTVKKAVKKPAKAKPKKVTRKKVVKNATKKTKKKTTAKKNKK